MSHPAHFDRIGSHFLKNIYTRAKGQIRLAVLQRDLAALRDGDRRLRVLDIGGGAGHMALWFLSAGHEVTLIDSSEELLSEARTMAEAAGVSEQLTVRRGDALNADTYPEQLDFDVVCCHAVLEWVSDGAGLLAQCYRALADDGVLSLMYYNYDALNFIQHVFANFEYLADGLHSANAAKLTPKYPRKQTEVVHWLESLGFADAQCISGVRCFYDYMKPRDRERQPLDDIIAHELTMSQQACYLPVARYIHECHAKHS
ncbi:methyltransferase domain-containing protein [Suttonella sp. R2A3]|uniref:methyltransferase domain-containing protein n=1 Tax=Suttonella sp. R2A3 TaxID=2908648 RepID=UPI001F16A041|nr:methyltransferase domain-containing protein [Suttonella sp. R2A3]UJF24383.1 methyltransferase domain-containing protein [Suttonella sp. R2A3]